MSYSHSRKPDLPVTHSSPLSTWLSMACSLILSPPPPKMAVEFNNNNVDNSDYFTTSTFNNVVRSQVGNYFIMHENICSFGKFFDEFHSFASELYRVADVIVLSETWFSVNTCHDVQGYTGFHIYRADKPGGGVSVFIRKCYTSTHLAKFSVCQHIMR